MVAERGVMPTSQRSWIEELYVGVIGWIWIAASLVTVYFLVRAVFFGDGWWRVVASVAVAWFLYKVTLYYQLEKTGQLPNE
jgi:ABC-type Co2+ transport system permease subunit